MRSLAAVGSVVLVVAAWVVGCAGKQDPAGVGKDCYRDEDCQTGLVCVANTSGNRVCSKDVKGLESMVDGPPPADTGTAPATMPGTAGAP